MGMKLVLVWGPCSGEGAGSCTQCRAACGGTQAQGVGWAGCAVHERATHWHVACASRHPRHQATAGRTHRVKHVQQGVVRRGPAAHEGQVAAAKRSEGVGEARRGARQLRPLLPRGAARGCCCAAAAPSLCARPLVHALPQRPRAAAALVRRVLCAQPAPALLRPAPCSQHPAQRQLLQRR